MDGHFEADATLPESAQDARIQDATTDTDPAVEAASTEYLGRWNRLVSTTNWEKGHIISEWRAALIEAGSPSGSYTDESWSRRVGNVTPQHTGRLRRVYQRFGQKREAFSGLFWSHFQAALDWDEGEMWLEGAVQNKWSIAEMQQERAKTFGAFAPAESDSTSVEVDEDAPAETDGQPGDAISASMAEVRDTGDAEQWDEESEAPGGEAPFDTIDSYADQAPPVRPFENMRPLPANLQDAFEAFKLAIIHHRLTSWEEIPCEDVLAALDALRALAEAPTQA